MDKTNGRHDGNNMENNERKATNGNNQLTHMGTSNDNNMENGTSMKQAHGETNGKQPTENSTNKQLTNITGNNT